MAARSWNAFGTLLLVATLACESPTQPMPVGAVIFEPDRALWRQWWAQVETCSARRGGFDAVNWYVVPGADGVDGFQWDGYWARGLWMSDGNRIVLAEGVTTLGRVVRHEMLHALLRVDGHPLEFFQKRCGAVVD